MNSVLNCAFEDGDNHSILIPAKVVFIAANLLSLLITLSHGPREDSACLKTAYPLASPATGKNQIQTFSSGIGNSAFTTPVAQWPFALGSTATFALHFASCNGLNPIRLTHRRFIHQRATRPLGSKRLNALPNPTNIKGVMPLANRGLCSWIFRSQQQGNTKHECSQDGSCEHTSNLCRTQRRGRHAIKTKLIQVY